MHTRPPDVRGRYLFRYGVYLWLIDLDALPRLPRLLAPLGRVRSRDHLGDPDRSIRAERRRVLGRARRRSGRAGGCCC